MRIWLVMNDKGEPAAVFSHPKLADVYLSQFRGRNFSYFEVDGEVARLRERFEGHQREAAHYLQKLEEGLQAARELAAADEEAE